MLFLQKLTNVVLASVVRNKPAVRTEISLITEHVKKDITSRESTDQTARV